MLTSARAGTTGFQCAGAGVAIGARYTAKVGPSWLVCTNSASPRGVTSYSTPALRPATDAGACSGDDAGTSHASLVVWLLDPTTIHALSLLRATARSKCSSGSR